MDDFIKIAHSLGLPGVALLMGFYLLTKIGAAVYDGFSWLGPNFLNPIRDGLVGNISVLTMFVTEMRAMIPVLKSGHEKSLESAGKVVSLAETSANDSAKTRQMQIALARVLANKCDVDRCPLLKNVSDSDTQEKKKS